MSVSPTKSKTGTLPELAHVTKGRRSIPARVPPSKARGAKSPQKALSLPPLLLRRDGGRSNSQLQRYKAQLNSRSR